MPYLKTCVFPLLFVCNSLFANTLTLEVSDDGRPLAMAEVILSDATSKKVVDSQFTDKNGMYVYSKTTGQFNVMVSKDEYSTGVLKNIVLNQQKVVKKMDLVPSAFSDTANNPDGGFGDNSDGCDD